MIPETLLTVAAILAIVLSLYTIYQNHRTFNKLKEAIATRYLGKFPECWPALIDLIASAKSSIEIVCTFHTPAVFSDTHQFHNYYLALAKSVKQEHMNTAVIVGDETKFDDFLDKQAPWIKNPKQYQEKMRDTAYRERLEATRESTLVDKKKYPLDQLLLKPAMFNSLLRHHAKFVENVFSDGQVEERNGDFSVWFWIVDGSAFLFIPNYQDGLLTGTGFLTQDKGLIEGLREISSRLLQSVT